MLKEAAGSLVSRVSTFGTAPTFMGPIIGHIVKVAVIWKIFFVSMG